MLLMILTISLILFPSACYPCVSLSLMCFCLQRHFIFISLQRLGAERTLDYNYNYNGNDNDGNYSRTYLPSPFNHLANFLWHAGREPVKGVNYEYIFRMPKNYSPTHQLTRICQHKVLLVFNVILRLFQLLCHFARGLKDSEP